MSKNMNLHEKRNNKRHSHYSLFYSGSERKLIDQFYKNDIDQFGYKFEDCKTGLSRLKNYL